MHIQMTDIVNVQPVIDYCRFRLLRVFIATLHDNITLNADFPGLTSF